MAILEIVQSSLSLNQKLYRPPVYPPNPFGLYQSSLTFIGQQLRIKKHAVIAISVAAAAAEAMLKSFRMHAKRTAAKRANDLSTGRYSLALPR